MVEQIGRRFAGEGLLLDDLSGVAEAHGADGGIPEAASFGYQTPSVRVDHAAQGLDELVGLGSVHPVEASNRDGHEVARVGSHLRGLSESQRT